MCVLGDSFFYLLYFCLEVKIVRCVYPHPARLEDYNYLLPTR